MRVNIEQGQLQIRKTITSSHCRHFFLCREIVVHKGNIPCSWQISLFSSYWCRKEGLIADNSLNFYLETHDCKDREKSRCPRLKEEGYCESTNPVERLTMRNNCALTCNFCREQHYFFKEAVSRVGGVTLLWTSWNVENCVLALLRVCHLLCNFTVSTYCQYML